MCKMNRALILLAALAGTMVSAAELPENDGYTHEGVATCATSQCHGSAVPRDGSNVLQNEYVTWTQSDPHSRAWDTLSNDLSRAMARRSRGWHRRPICQSLGFGAGRGSRACRQGVR